MITSLRMRRWKSHEDTEMKFGKGSNVFIGKMGSGKSSAIDAICFALFGTFPALKSRRVKIEELVMQRPKKHTAAEIELEFELDGKDYRILRKIGERTTSAQIFEGARLLEAQTSRVTELIEGILKIDYDLFSRIIYAEQNRIDYLLNLPKGERKRQIDELLGISRFEEVRANATTAINKINSNKRELERYLEGAGALGLREDAIELKSKEEQSLIELREKERALAESNSLLKKRHEELGGMEKTEKEHQLTEKELASANALLEEKKREIEMEGREFSEKKLMETQEALNSLQLQLQEKRRELQNANREFSAVSARLEMGKEERKKRERSLHEREKLVKRQTEISSSAELKAKIAESENRLNALIKEISKFEAEGAELNKALQALHTAAAKCPICEAELAAERKKELMNKRSHAIKHSDEKIIILRKELQELNSRSEGMKAILEEAKLLEAKLKELGNAETEMNKIIGEISEFEKTAAELGKAQESLAKQIELVERDAAYLSKQLYKLERIPRLKRDVKALEAKKGVLSEKIKELKYSPEKLAELRKTLLASERQNASLKSQKEALSQQRAKLQEELSAIERKISEISEKEKGISELNRKISTLSEFQEAVIETQALMREQLIGAMNEAMNSLWGSIYPYGDYSQIRLNADEEDYVLELNTSENEWIGIENCSGGERSSAGLTLRVAFAMVLTPNLSWLILDEPTHNLDAQAVQLLNRALHDEIPKIVEQTFIITHDEALKEGASAKTFYFERDKDKSERSFVEEYED